MGELFSKTDIFSILKEVIPHFLQKTFILFVPRYKYFKNIYKSNNYKAFIFFNGQWFFSLKTISKNRHILSRIATVQALGETAKKAKCVFGIFPHTGHYFFHQKYSLRLTVHNLFLPNPALNRHSTKMITHCYIRRVNVVLIYLSWDILYKTKSKHIFTLTLICA